MLEYCRFPSVTLYSLSFLQPQKGQVELPYLVGFSMPSLPIEITLSGIVMEVSPLQASNALSPMVIRLLGNVMEVKPPHPSNASSSIVVTLLGIMTDVSLEL